MSLATLEKCINVNIALSHPQINVWWRRTRTLIGISIQNYHLQLQPMPIFSHAIVWLGDYYNKWATGLQAQQGQCYFSIKVDKTPLCSFLLLFDLVFLMSSKCLSCLLLFHLTFMMCWECVSFLLLFHLLFLMSSKCLCCLLLFHLSFLMCWECVCFLLFFDLVFLMCSKCLYYLLLFHLSFLMSRECVSFLLLFHLVFLTMLRHSNPACECTISINTHRYHVPVSCCCGR